MLHPLLVGGDAAIVDPALRGLRWTEREGAFNVGKIAAYLRMNLAGDEIPQFDWANRR